MEISASGSDTDSTVFTFLVPVEVPNSVLKLHPDSVLATVAFMTGGNNPPTIPRDLVLFNCVIDYMTNGRVCVPVGQTKDLIKKELDYYGVDYCDNCIDDREARIEKAICDYQKKLERMESPKFINLCINFLQDFKLNGGLQNRLVKYTASRSVYESYWELDDWYGVGRPELIERINSSLFTAGVKLDSKPCGRQFRLQGFDVHPSWY